MESEPEDHLALLLPVEPREPAPPSGVGKATPGGVSGKAPREFSFDVALHRYYDDPRGFVVEISNAVLFEDGVLKSGPLSADTGSFLESLFTKEMILSALASSRRREPSFSRPLHLLFCLYLPVVLIIVIMFALAACFFRPARPAFLRISFSLVAWLRYSCCCDMFATLLLDWIVDLKDSDLDGSYEGFSIKGMLVKSAGFDDTMGPIRRTEDERQARLLRERDEREAATPTLKLVRLQEETKALLVEKLAAQDELIAKLKNGRRRKSLQRLM